MCNHCDASGILSIEEYEAEVDDICEFIAENEDEDPFEEELYSCFEKPAFIVLESFVEEHLCEFHAKMASDQESVTGYMTEATGLGTARVEPIESGDPITCEFFDLLNPNADECENRATHALIIEAELLLCPEHLEEYKDSED